MPLTRNFRDTVRARAEREPAFRRALFQEAVQALLQGETDEGRAALRAYINATVGFDRLALLWQIYSRCCFSLICLLQYGHRCGRGRTMSSTMAWRTAGRLG